jgi:prepilin-type N-terminal cleavage/methylation domain-containing protein
MLFLKTQSRPFKAKPAFTLVELLVVIAIISILMTAGSIGLSSLGGKGVTSGVANAEALFNEARSTAVGKNIRACVLVAKKLTNNPADDLRRIIVAYEEIETNTNSPNYGKPKVGPDQPVQNWILSSRGSVLPEQTFFSSKFSKKDQGGAGGSLDTVTLGANAKNAYKGDYYVYVFNSQGICTTPGASFVIGSGARSLTKSADSQPPRVTTSAKRDFGGFIIWRNGSTSVFRSPEQIGVGTLSSGDTF